MKKFSWVLFSFAILCLLSFSFNACKKINESTAIGAGLIPTVDNINTFETYLDVETNNKLATDTTKFYFGDDIALGAITNDAEFGATKANAYFNVGPPAYGTYPFYNKDSVLVDSIVLSLGYKGAYGDTLSPLTVHVFEIAQDPNFGETDTFAINHPDFLTTGSELGSKTFTPHSLRDSVPFIRKGVVTGTVNTLRISLNNSLAQRLINYDTSGNSTSGAYKSYGAFYGLFKGLALKSDLSGSSNALAYFNISSSTASNLTVYYRVHKNGVIDTTSTSFAHGALSLTDINQTATLGAGHATTANIITRIPGGNWLSYLNNGLASDDKLYVQSTPGSIATIRIPQLDTFANRVIYRAELISTVIPSSGQDKFNAPPSLFLDRLTSTDSAYDIVDDFIAGSFAAVNQTSAFGGKLGYDNTYRFNITRHVQNIITHSQPNDTLRLYAPFRNAITASPQYKVPKIISILPELAYGRVVLAGGNYSDPSKRLRLHIIYSKL